MFRRFLRSSIQKVLVTGTRDKCDGELTLDGDLMDATGLLPNDTVLCTNEHNGNQFLANIRRGRRRRGELILNTRQGMAGDRVTIDRYDSFSKGQMKGGTRRCCDLHGYRERQASASDSSDSLRTPVPTYREAFNIARAW